MLTTYHNAGIMGDLTLKKNVRSGSLSPGITGRNLANSGFFIAYQHVSLQITLTME